jgi:hypothetical protein
MSSPDKIDLALLWRAVSHFRHATNASAALKLAVVNTLELIWAIEDSRDTC